MAVFSLVHGGQHGAWCFEPLARELERRGHRALAVDLPITDPDAGAAKYAEAVVESLRDAGDDAVLVGHSMGGLVIPLVAARRPVRRLVFLCGAVPEIGRSHFQVRAEEAAEPVGAGARTVWEQPGDSHLATPDAARAMFYHDLPLAQQEWALQRMRPQQRRPLREVTPLEAWPDVPVTLINTSEDRCISLEAARHTAQRLFGQEPLVLPGGHFGFLARPVLFADALEALAAVPA
jgi:pimeloyl-ACP methyl ester carboxylesterase